MNNNVKKWILELFQIALGTAIMAVAISFFMLPNQLSSGGFSGIATITYYLFNFPMGTVIMLLNVPLFIFSFFKIGRSFLIKAVTGTALLSVFIDIFDRFEPLTNDRFLACIYGGILIGLRNSICAKGRRINRRLGLNKPNYKEIQTTN